MKNSGDSIEIMNIKLSKNKWKLNRKFKINLKDNHEFLQYTDTLHKYKEKQRKKVNKLKLTNKTGPHF